MMEPFCLPPSSDCENDDVLEIKTIKFSGGTQLTVKNADNSFVYARTSMAVIFLVILRLRFLPIQSLKRIMLKDGQMDLV